MSQIEKKVAATTSYNDANKNQLNSLNLLGVTFLFIWGWPVFINQHKPKIYTIKNK